MTAPIVTQDHEREVTGTALLLFGIFYGNVETRGAAVVAESGQLWERLEEHDVAVHGEPQPENSRQKMRRQRHEYHSPSREGARAVLDELIAIRREKARAHG